jgi:DHA1 family bicyclomycin/chloramphenicol resistance-like MFS transporter
MWMLAVLSALMAFASISTDFHLPALPTMAVAPHADPGVVALTISGYPVGFSLGQPVWGPVGDRYGRTVPVAIGLVLFVFVSTTGLIVANAMAGALAAYPDRAGAVSALVGSIQYGAAMIGSALVGVFADGTPRPMGVIVALSAVGGVLCPLLLGAMPVVGQTAVSRVPGRPA